MRSTAHPWWVPYFFVSPFALIFLVFISYPLVESVLLSFEQTYGPKTSVFIGMDNFRFLLKDERFWTAVKNNCVFALASLGLQLTLSLGLAVLLNHPKVKAKAFFRLILYAPSLVGTVFVGVLFNLIFHAHDGLLNSFLRSIIPGFPQDFPWLQNYVMTAIVLSSLWLYVGYNMVFFLAALQNVEQELNEAAAIDGANAWQRFVHITIPAIAPIAGFVVLMSLIGSFQLFELPFILLGRSSGPEDRGLTLVMYLYENGFQVGDLGYASAIGWVLSIILIILAVAQRLMVRED